MKCALPVIVLVIALTKANPVPPEPTTSRSSPPIGETIKLLTDQLMEANSTITLDTRTPPKVKQQQRQKIKEQSLENSHAGVAIPMSEDEVLEETTKKLNFYKIEKPTTNSGLSTWILLSGTVSTTKPPPKTNQTLVEPNKVIIKPIFKKRTTTTTPKTSTTKTTATPKTTTTRLTKIKASLVSSKKTTSRATTTTAKPSTTVTQNATTLPPAEAKDGETDLTSSEDKKSKSTKKPKRNKNRRRRPADKSDNSTKIEKATKTKEKPISTQLYNYLSREVMPTVGVGLVGLMVTAGLASYFLYPFGVARRSYEVDRKDKEGSYYYDDNYYGGIAEEDAIGKVIAGMPSNSLFGNNANSKSSRQRNHEEPVSYTSKDENLGNQEEATPVAVPEHGPRKRRELPPNEKENEIKGNENENEINGNEEETITIPSITTTVKPNKLSSFVDMLGELLHVKINLGLHLIRNATQTVSQYFSEVQRRFNQHYRSNASEN